MAKGFGGMGGGMGGMGDMLRQAQKMQQEMGRIQADLKERVVEGSAGGGAVKAFANGAQELVSIKIEPSAVDPQDPSMLEDLVLAAVQNALKASQELMAAEMKKVTGGLGLPPGLGL